MKKLFESKKSGNSSRVTLGDPKYYPNRYSDKTVNTAKRPQLPDKGN